MNIEKYFDKFDDEFLKFDRVVSPYSTRPDLCAFIMLDKLQPSQGVNRDLIQDSEHDQIWFDIDVEELVKSASESDMRDLVRCGVRYDASIGCLSMYK